MRAASKKIWAACISFSLASGCATLHPPRAPMSEGEQREMESRTYPVADSSAINRALIDSLQDQHYVIETSDASLGVITAHRQLDLTSSELRRSDQEWLRAAIFIAVIGVIVLIAVFTKGGGLGGGNLNIGPVGASSTPNPRAMRVTCTVHWAPDQGRTRVRVNFERSLVDEFGAVTQTSVVNDSAYYREFFGHLDKARFLQAQAL